MKEMKKKKEPNWIIKDLDKAFETVFDNNDKNEKYQFYYCSNDCSKKEKILFLLEKPGNLSDENEGKKKKKKLSEKEKDKLLEKEKLRECEEDSRFIDIVNEYLEKWIKANKKFREIEKKFDFLFDDYIVTDVIKLREEEKLCEKKIKEVIEEKFGETKIEEVMKEILKKEIEETTPKLILAMGNEPWRYLKEIFPDDNLKRIVPEEADKKDFKKSRIAEIHGDLFEGKFNDGNIFYIMPLIHPSAKTICPKDAYTHYMKEGIERYRTLQQNKNEKGD